METPAEIKRENEKLAQDDELRATNGRHGLGFIGISHIARTAWFNHGMLDSRFGARTRAAMASEFD